MAIKIKQSIIPRKKFKTKVKKEIHNDIWEKLSNQFARPAEQKAKQDRSKIIYREVEDFKKNLPLLTVKELMAKYGNDEKQARSIRDSVHRVLLKQEKARAERARILASFQIQTQAQSSQPTQKVPTRAVRSLKAGRRVSRKEGSEVPLVVKSGFEIDSPLVPDSPIEINRLAYRSTPVATDTSPLSHDFQIAGMALQKIRLQHGIEIRKHGEQTAIQEGFVYLVQHPLFEGWVKAGMTIDFELRLATYNVADPLSRFSMSRLKWTENRRQAEINLMEALSRVADQRSGEWFEVDFERACIVFGDQVCA
jgi:T5orf172 domain